MGCVVLGTLPDISVTEMDSFIRTNWGATGQGGDWMHDGQWNCVAWAFRIVGYFNDNGFLEPAIRMPLDTLNMLVYRAAVRMDLGQVRVNAAGMMRLFLAQA